MHACAHTCPPPPTHTHTHNAPQHRDLFHLLCVYVCVCVCVCVMMEWPSGSRLHRSEGLPDSQTESTVTMSPRRVMGENITAKLIFLFVRYHGDTHIFRNEIWHAVYLFRFFTVVVVFIIGWLWVFIIWGGGGGVR